MLQRTAVQIPCCLCGTYILPNAANKCGACLASQHDLAALLQRGPGGGDIVVHQCRQCRQFQKTAANKSGGGAVYQALEMESPELLALCLKQIPALAPSASSSPHLHVADAKWIWTEPHSMRFKVHLTVRLDIDNVPVQQRVMVELKVAWKQCPECNREFTNRTWHALVQLRQVRDNNRHSTQKGLAALEQAVAQQPALRKHVLKIDAARHGLDFYFLHLAQAQAFAAFLARTNPLRIKTSQKLVSTDVKNNTANVKHTVTCDLVPLCRDDLVLVKKGASSARLAGRLALVVKASSVLTLLDASPRRTHDVQHSLMELGAAPYYKNEKHFRVLQSSERLTRFVVLDVELCNDNDETGASGPHADDPAGGVVLYEGPPSGVSKYALADVLVAREADFGVNNVTFSVVTHLGHLLQAGDTVLGYDLESTVGGDWELDDRTLHAHFELPDVVLVKKVTNHKRNKNGKKTKNGEAAEGDEEEARNGPGATTKKRERRRRRKEGKKRRELEASAVRMGFFEDEEETKNQHDNDDNFAEELNRDPELRAQLQELETALEEAIPEGGASVDTTAETSKEESVEEGLAEEEDEGARR